MLNPLEMYVIRQVCYNKTNTPSVNPFRMLPTLKVKRFDTSLPMPEYQTEGSVGIDLYARVETTLKPQEIVRIPLNVALKLPEGYWGLLAARGSLHKKGLAPMNGLGIFDSDYCGDGDEYHGLIINLGSQSVTVEKGERIMQVVLIPKVLATIEEVTTMTAPDRGGFGSTGTHA